MFPKTGSSDQAHGMLSEWTRRAPTTGHALPSDPFINRIIFH